MADRRVLKAKVCLIGERAVGKTSLIRRFVLDVYDDRYVATIGTKISKRSVPVRLADGGIASVDMTIWDIMGAQEFRELLRDAYFFGTQGLVAVADLTRASTLSELARWVDGATRVAGEVPVLVAANKSDLEADAQVDPGRVEDFAARVGGSYLLTSAKTGRNVEETFRRLAGFIVEEEVGPVAEGPEPKAGAPGT